MVAAPRLRPAPRAWLGGRPNLGLTSSSTYLMRLPSGDIRHASTQRLRLLPPVRHYGPGSEPGFCSRRGPLALFSESLVGFCIPQIFLQTTGCRQPQKVFLFYNVLAGAVLFEKGSAFIV